MQNNVRDARTFIYAHGFQHSADESIRQVRLDRDDANLVDIIHTNAGELDVIHLLDIVNRTDVVDGKLVQV